MADVAGSSSLWQLLQAGDIREATSMLREKGHEALRNPRVSILEDVLPLALQSLASSYDQNGIVGDEAKYFDLARELWRFMSDTERGIPEMVCTFMYAGSKFNQPAFVRWILPIVAAHPAVEMAGLAGDRSYAFNQLRHSAIYYIARNGNIELYDLLTSACAGVSPLLLECQFYDDQAVGITVSSTAAKPRGHSYGSDMFESDTMLASGRAGGESPDPPSLYVALIAGQTDFVRHALASLHAQAQARVLRLTVVYGILPSDDIEAAQNLYRIASETSPDSFANSSAPPYVTDVAGDGEEEVGREAQKGSEAHGDSTSVSSHAGSLINSRLVDSAACVFGFGCGRDCSQAPGSHTASRSRTASEASTSMLSTASDNTVLTSAVPPDVSSTVSPAPLLSPSAGDALFSPFYSYALHLALFTAEGSAEPGARRKRQAVRYAAWLIRTFRGDVLKPLARMRWSGASALLATQDGALDDVRLPTIRSLTTSPGRPGALSGGSMQYPCVWTNWLALHSAAAAPCPDLIQKVLAVDKSQMHSAARAGLAVATVVGSNVRSNSDTSLSNDAAPEQGSSSSSSNNSSSSNGIVTLFPVRIAVETALWSGHFEASRVLAQWLTPAQLEEQLYAPARCMNFGLLKPAFVKTLCKETVCLTVRPFRHAPTKLQAPSQLEEGGEIQQGTPAVDATQPVKTPLSVRRRGGAGVTYPSTALHQANTVTEAFEAAVGDEVRGGSGHVRFQSPSPGQTNTISQGTATVTAGVTQHDDDSDSPMESPTLEAIAGSHGARLAKAALKKRRVPDPRNRSASYDSDRLSAGRSVAGTAAEVARDGSRRSSNASGVTDHRALASAAHPPVNTWNNGTSANSSGRPTVGAMGVEKGIGAGQGRRAGAEVQQVRQPTANAPESTRGGTGAAVSTGTPRAPPFVPSRAPSTSASSPRAQARALTKGARPGRISREEESAEADKNAVLASTAAADAQQEARDAQIEASVRRSRSVAGLAALSYSPDRLFVRVEEPEGFIAGLPLFTGVPDPSRAPVGWDEYEDTIVPGGGGGWLRRERGKGSMGLSTGSGSAVGGGWDPIDAGLDEVLGLHAASARTVHGLQLPLPLLPAVLLHGGSASMVHGTATPAPKIGLESGVVTDSQQSTSKDNQIHFPAGNGIEVQACARISVTISTETLLAASQGPLRCDVYAGRYGLHPCAVSVLEVRAAPAWLLDMHVSLSAAWPGGSTMRDIAQEAVPSRLRIAGTVAVSRQSRGSGTCRLARQFGHGLSPDGCTLYCAGEGGGLAIDACCAQGDAGEGEGLDRTRIARDFMSVLADLHTLGIAHTCVQPSAIMLDANGSVLLAYAVHAAASLDVCILGAEGGGAEGEAGFTIGALSRLAACLQALLGYMGDWCSPEVLRALHAAVEASSAPGLGSTGSPSKGAHPSVSVTATAALSCSVSALTSMCTPEHDAYCAGLTLYALLTGRGRGTHPCGPAWTRQAGILSGQHALAGVDLGSHAGAMRVMELGLAPRHAVAIAALLRPQAEDRLTIAAALDLI